MIPAEKLRGLLANPRDAHEAVELERHLHLGVERAIAAGAKPPLSFLGQGAFGIVFCDVDNFAWKVDYFPLEEHEHEAAGCVSKGLREEYEFLETAGQVPEISDYIIKVYSWDPKNLAMKRECVWGQPGTWAMDQRELSELHARIGQVMQKHGWTAPEFKEDSYVLPAGREEQETRWILVDGGLSMRIGAVLAHYVEDVLAGRRPLCDRWRDLAFYVQREASQEDGLPTGRVIDLVRRIIPHLTHEVDIRDASHWIKTFQEKM